MSENRELIEALNSSVLMNNKSIWPKNINWEIEISLKEGKYNYLEDIYTTWSLKTKDLLSKTIRAWFT